ncbi:class I SAM-dependent methyltransferase [Acidocella sp.]|uniref:class I SAM-dependent methyltransferase n=1 Tax=Acidocella sp. TaxID=50710 RepID=UPI002F40DC72
MTHNDHAFVRGLFNDTAPYYDTVNRIFSLGSGNWYRRRCLLRAGLKSGQTVLDVAIGTGLIAQAALPIVGAHGKVIGLDLSEAMLKEARRRLDIPLIQGTAETLPLADETVDFIVMGYAIRHIADLEACFNEFRRVLRRGGTLLLLEVSSPTRPIFKSTLAQYLGRGVPRLSQWVTRQPKLRSLMTYHWETMEACVPPPVILDTMARSGFGPLVCEGWFDLFRSYAGQRQGSENGDSCH